MVITSRDNPAIKRVRGLLGSAKARKESGRFVLEGARLCEDAARSGIEVEAAFLTARAEEAYPDQTRAVRQVAGTVYEIPENLAAFIGDTQHPQGVFCVCAPPPARLSAEELPKNGRFMALENVRDPGNLGTIIRTAEAFGIDGLLLSAGCCELYSPKVLRGSMGGALRLPVAVVPDLPAAISRWNEQGFRTVACVADASATPLPEAKLGDGCMLFIGNEANGLTAETQAACTARMTIPMKGRAESLNAAVAACIALWELSR